MISWINQLLVEHITYLPYLGFILLIIAGFNIPISEDIVLITCAILASAYKSLINPYLLYVTLSLGAYLGDFVSYFIGYYLGEQIFSKKPFNRWVKPQLLNKLSVYIRRYGIVTLFLGRFIPFGVRNTLFLTCGLSKMRLFVFACTDALATLTSTSITYSLAYLYGRVVSAWLKKCQLILFYVLLGLLLLYLLYNLLKKRQTN